MPESIARHIRPALRPARAARASSLVPHPGARPFPLDRRTPTRLLRPFRAGQSAPRAEIGCWRTGISLLRSYMGYKCASVWREMHLNWNMRPSVTVAVGPLRAKAILSRSESGMDFAVPCRGRRRFPVRPGMTESRLVPTGQGQTKRPAHGEPASGHWLWVTDYL